ncbi:uncharacterized protein N0V89_008548 [Didymosphaeria variabile]|uniref:DUF7730 domain-containing protein n=1 Tax=Didymosphaeria variabile TaxID=1932322 RepID=A0A9W9C8X7_9PLEO|nr:uncharacterized protein N0V89_008548 [Didymosphaeria variabile]KAJ4349928.1 hypothetical protein N0V89_008548 [Didymosphaeria variabile]
MAEPTSPLLRLPFEIRLMIYEALLFPSKTPSSSHSTSVANLLPDFHTYHSNDTNDTPFTLAVRTIDPYAGVQSSRGWRHRSTYHVRTVPSLLSLNHQIHTEAAKVLYSNYTFSFHTSIEAAVPFFSDLTPLSRGYVRHISLTKKGLPYTKEFDRLEWAALCTYLSRNLCLSGLSLSIVAGKPGEHGWDGVAPISKEALALMQRMKKDWGSSVGGADLTWVEQLFEVKGLREVKVEALVEHCPGAIDEEEGDIEADIRISTLWSIHV